MFTKIFALLMALAMLCTGCGLSGAPAESTDTPDASSTEPSNTDVGSTDVKVGLEQNVYEIPDYTNAGSDVKVLRLSVSMGAGDYGTSASGVMFKTFVDRIEELSGGKMVAQVYPASQLASTTDDIINGLLTNAFEMAEVGTGNWGDYTNAFTPMNTPFLYSSDEVCYEVMSGEMGQIMSDQLLADTGIRATGFMYLGMRTITNNTREIHSPADLKGSEDPRPERPHSVGAVRGAGRLYHDRLLLRAVHRIAAEALRWPGQPHHLRCLQEVL